MRRERRHETARSLSREMLAAAVNRDRLEKFSPGGLRFV